MADESGRVWKRIRKDGSLMNTQAPVNVVPLTAADYASDQAIRWCPGCGDYAILAAVKKTFAKLAINPAKTVFVSGIGCSSRFPYYMNTYGMHSIHGRAPAIATGLKLARPDLNVWVVTGDGDALSIGGNHFIHLMRRNVDLKILLFNNRIYGLTKGQYSPTSELGKVTKSAPMGSPDTPLRPASVAIAAEASFVARSIDRDLKHLEYVLERAAKHVGTAFLEIYQNCNIFNDGAFEYATEKSSRAQTTLLLEHGKPMVFGSPGSEKGITLDRFTPAVVDLAGAPRENVLVHDETIVDPSLHFLLSRMRHPQFPEPMGVLRCIDRERYNETVHSQLDKARTRFGDGDLARLIDGPEPWEVR